ncbi:hypothetical protein EWM64_g10225 [Hericium alpestre]|uniref:Uncharacterized protein n=1 Tax=Hericium alpestre TaxID=135208 RepID=A0A4Y9ZJE5_9AGAM|nr:hypothetical protein EWM64_g10225 [Hericium alpestre]
MQPDASLKDTLLVGDAPIMSSTIPVVVAVDDPKGKKRAREDEVGGEGGAGEPLKKRTANDSDGNSQIEEMEKVDEEQENDDKEEDDDEVDDADNKEEGEEEESEENDQGEDVKTQS